MADVKWAAIAVWRALTCQIATAQRLAPNFTAAAAIKSESTIVCYLYNNKMWRQFVCNT